MRQFIRAQRRIYTQPTSGKFRLSLFAQLMQPQRAEFQCFNFAQGVANDKRVYLSIYIICCILEIFSGLVWVFHDSLEMEQA